jgi:hypothetical protein
MIQATLSTVLTVGFSHARWPRGKRMSLIWNKTSGEEGGRDTLVGDPISVEGCAYDLIKQAVDISKEIISKIQINLCALAK